MKIVKEISIDQFQGWNGADDIIDKIIKEGKVDEFDAFIEELYPNGISERELNAMLVYENDWIYEILGIKN